VELGYKASSSHAFRLFKEEKCRQETGNLVRDRSAISKKLHFVTLLQELKVLSSESSLTPGTDSQREFPLLWMPELIGRCKPMIDLPGFGVCYVLASVSEIYASQHEVSIEVNTKFMSCCRG